MINKGFFYIELDHNEALDLGSLAKEDWRKIDALSKQVLAEKHTNNDKVAFVAAFLHYIMVKQTNKEPFASQMN